MSEPREPGRLTRLCLLEPEFRGKVEALLEWMERLGFDPEVFESLRSSKRQEWLYGVGRTHHLRRRPVTWVRYSRHQAGVAVDIVSRRRGWSDPRFFSYLRRGAERLGLEALPHDPCHVQIK